MATTIDTSYFFGNLGIANVTDPAVVSGLNWFINEYEPKLLTDLLGYELYKAYSAAITGGSPAQKWLDLRDGKEYTDLAGRLRKWKGLKFTDGTAKKSLIANYVFWQYLASKSSQSSANGESKATQQNSVPVSEAYKLATAWNQMVDYNSDMVDFLFCNQATYPEFTTWYGYLVNSELLRYQNVLGI